MVSAREQSTVGAQTLFDHPRVTIQGVGRTFPSATGDVVALQEVDLDIPDGQFCCLVGPSGCGKTTLLRILAGLANPSVGRAVVRHDDPTRLARSVVFQDYSVFPWKTVRENVELPIRAQGVGRREAQEISTTWLRRVGLSGFEEAWPTQLSGGMRQRVAIARAFACNPEMLLMDEPLAALDAQMRLLLQEQLLALSQEEAKTVVFVTHSIEEAILLGDRIIVMGARPGRVIADVAVPFERPRSPAEVRQEERFGELHEHIWSLIRSQVEDQLRKDEKAK
ncbi:ABC transporter ATP-binding protein [Streptosporangium sp. NPDC002544]|uniref:ABC transporter ATP-binding protein n=1 Tax=unclassified Streptosporangium TaxID=2632669 RepID=UPI0033282CE8